MPSDSELLLGRIAIEFKFCTEAQVDLCLEIQARSKDSIPLGHQLVQEGYLTQEQHSKVLQVQRGRMIKIDPVANTSKEGALFGRLAVREGMVTQDQLNACLRLQGRAGEKRTLGELMVAEGILSRDQVKELLARQSKKIMSCAPCNVSFTVHTISEGKPIHCPRCKAPLAAGKPGDSVRTDAELQSDSAIHARKGSAQKSSPPSPAGKPRPSHPCRICEHPFVGDAASDGRVECLSCHSRFVP